MKERHIIQPPPPPPTSFPPHPRRQGETKTNRILTMVPHSVTLSFATCFTATCDNTKGEKDNPCKHQREVVIPGDGGRRGWKREGGWWRRGGGTLMAAHGGSRRPYRCAIGDAAAGVDGPEPTAAQHRAHLVDLLEGLLFHFDWRRHIKTHGVKHHHKHLGRDHMNPTQCMDDLQLLAL